MKATLCLLFGMMFCCALKSNENDAVVKIQLGDALKLNDVTLLKKELIKMQEAMYKLELDNKNLLEERNLIYNEFIELNKKYEEQNENFDHLKLLIADVTTSSDVRKSSEVNEKILRKIGDYSKYGGELGLKSIEFCEFIESELNELPIGKVRQAEIQLRIDALKLAVNRFSTLGRGYLDPKSTVDSCRILEIDKKLNCVILSAGSIHGAFNGLHFRAGKRSVVLKVVAVRPFVTAALVVAGNINDLSPGMEAVSTKQEQK